MWERSGVEGVRGRWERGENGLREIFGEGVERDFERDFESVSRVVS